MRKLLIIISMLSLLISACGSIGTETGNPDVPQSEYDATGDAPLESIYRGSGISVTLPDNWVAEEWVTDTGNVEAVTFSAGSTGESSSYVIVYIVELEDTPDSLQEYLASERPTDTFETYNNYYISGLIYDDPEPGLNGGDLKEIYFLQDNILLYIAAELFEGSGSTEGEIILSTVNFAE